MKNTLRWLLAGFLTLVLTPALLTTGCSTVQVNTATKIVVRRATVEVLRKHPDYRSAIAASVITLDQVLLKPDLDRAKLTAALQSLRIRELKGPDGALILRDVLDLIDSTIAEKPLIGEGMPKLQSFLQSVSDGMSDALAVSAATP